MRFKALRQHARPMRERLRRSAPSTRWRVAVRQPRSRRWPGRRVRPGRRVCLGRRIRLRWHAQWRKLQAAHAAAHAQMHAPHGRLLQSVHGRLLHHAWHWHPRHRTSWGHAIHARMHHARPKPAALRWGQHVVRARHRHHHHRRARRHRRRDRRGRVLAYQVLDACVVRRKQAWRIDVGRRCGIARVPEASMWRARLVLNRAGVPSLTVLARCWASSVAESRAA